MKDKIFNYINNSNCIFLSYSLVFVVGMFWTKIIMPVFLIMGLIIILNNLKELKLNINNTNICMFFFIIIGLLSFFWSINQTATIIRMIKVIFVFIIVIILFSKYNSKNIFLSDDIFVYYFSVMILILLFIIIINDIFYFPLYKLYNIFFEKVDPNVNCHNKAISFLVIIFWPIASVIWNKGFKIVTIVIGVFLFIAVISSYSSSSRVALILSVIMMLLSLYFSRHTIFIILNFLFFIITPVMFVAFPIIINNKKIYDLFSFSIQHRIEIYDLVIKKILERPFFGWGIECTRFFEITENDVINHPIIEYLRKMPTHPHNIFLQIFVETGFIGIALFLYFIYLLNKSTFLLKDEYIVFAFCSITSCFVIGSTSYSLWSESFISIISLTVFLFYIIHCNLYFKCCKNT